MLRRPIPKEGKNVLLEKEILPGEIGGEYMARYQVLSCTELPNQVARQDTRCLFVPKQFSKILGGFWLNSFP